MSKEEQNKKLGKTIAKAWEDDAFKKRLLEDATTVFKEEGLSVPEGVEVKVVEDTEKVYHVILPPKSSHKLLSEADLGAVAGGGSDCYKIAPCDFVHKN